MLSVLDVDEIVSEFVKTEARRKTLTIHEFILNIFSEESTPDD